MIRVWSSVNARKISCVTLSTVVFVNMVTLVSSSYVLFVGKTEMAS